MDAIKKYVIEKRSYLNSPVSVDVWDSVIARRSSMSELECIYMHFNGDKYLDETGVFNYLNMVPHPLLSDIGILPVEVLIEDIEHKVDLWEQTEETLNLEEGTYPLRQFYPFITTGMGRGIGPIYAKNSKFNESVIEYDYEAGEFRVWATNLKSFIEAFFNFSVDRYVPTNDFEKDEAEYIFTDEDKAYLSKWPDIVYPLMGEEFMSDQELL